MASELRSHEENSLTLLCVSQTSQYFRGFPDSLFVDSIVKNNLAPIKMYGWILLFPTYQVRSGRHPVQFGSFFDPLRRLDSLFFFSPSTQRSWSTSVESIRVCYRRRGYLPPLRWTTMVPATMSYTVLLCWKKRRVMKTGKRKAMEKFLLSARTVELWKRKGTKQNRGWIKS